MLVPKSVRIGTVNPQVPGSSPGRGATLHVGSGNFRDCVSFRKTADVPQFCGIFGWNDLLAGPGTLVNLSRFHALAPELLLRETAHGIASHAGIFKQRGMRLPVPVPRLGGGFPVWVIARAERQAVRRTTRSYKADRASASDRTSCRN